MVYTRSEHTFHIPVMGTAFTVDTPLKVAKFGISSVMSIGDDELCETMREHYSREYGLQFEPILKWTDDFRVNRIRAYLDMVHEIVEIQMAQMKQLSFEPGNELTTYFELLPPKSELKQDYVRMLTLESSSEKEALQDALKSRLVPGSIDVNIMTKLDRENYKKDGTLLGHGYSDALSALRAFATSKLHSSIVFSAGFNRRLYAYLEEFPDFFPDETGYLKKKVIIKVSDYRSCHTQGKFLAKKGIWVSEYRIESGLNCGGHAFASQGQLLGPIMNEIKHHRHELAEMAFEACNAVLSRHNRIEFTSMPHLLVTVQGGIGTINEDLFLQEYYHVDGTGWASPFLLVPEATNLDMETRMLLAKADRDQFYTSDISPLGVPFNTVKGTESEHQKNDRIAQGKPGSPCPKAYLVSNTEFTERPICTASRTYQRLKLKQIEGLDLDSEAKTQAVHDVVTKACLCEDLAAGGLINYHIDNKRSLKTAVCPGPNLAYFSRIFSLKEMVDHIYGKIDILNKTYRPNMFISELKMYIDHFKKEIKASLPSPTDRQLSTLKEFLENLYVGIDHYKQIVPEFVRETKKYKEQFMADLLAEKTRLEEVISMYPALFSHMVFNA